MEKKTFFAAMLLMMVGLQTMWGQEMVLHKSNGEKIKCELSKLDSLVFVPKALPPTHGWVDLGLPSGTLWAKCNVGANKPEEYGDYFAWGETQPKDNYDLISYKWCNDDLEQLTKYCPISSYGYNGYTDTLSTLLPEDDAATVNWGDEWRMPTQVEWQELYDNTISTWTTQNGLNGRLFVASNGRTLFLPATGGRFGIALSSPNDYGNYWSSSLAIEEPAGAWYSGFRLDNYVVYYDGRTMGRSVRPVRSSK